MNIELAGFNVSKKVLEELLSELPKDKADEYRNKLTPIVLAAAYARISRSPKTVVQLVDEAIKDVPKAKESAQTIAFDMGHHSIADHCLFNFNIMGVSRLAVEEIEKRRIGVGYTEKSQRYVTFKGDFLRPKEFSDKDMLLFEELVEKQNKFYSETYPKIFSHLKEKYAHEIDKRQGDDKDKFIKTLEGWAKEDGRYSLCMAILTQLGCSYSGQSLELGIRDMKYGKLVEVRDISKTFQDITIDYRPILQLIDQETFKKYNQGKELKDENFGFTKGNLKQLVDRTIREKNIDSSRLINSTRKGLENKGYFYRDGDVTLLNSNDRDAKIIAALLHTNSFESLDNCYTIAHLMHLEERKEFIKESLKFISAFDKVPREFEFSDGLIYEVTMSSSCFAQAKRQRLNTLTAQDYYTELGYTYPQNIIDIGADEKLEEIYEASSNLYKRFLPKYLKAAEYVLTNGHMRRVLQGENLRQRYPVSRNREDEHAQWDIRNKEKSKSNLARIVAPATTGLLGGKSEFDEKRKKFMSR
jgi:thymidylate synthase ThyX